MCPQLAQGSASLPGGRFGNMSGRCMCYHWNTYVTHWNTMAKPVCLPVITGTRQAGSLWPWRLGDSGLPLPEEHLAKLPESTPTFWLGCLSSVYFWLAGPYTPGRILARCIHPIGCTCDDSRRWPSQAHTTKPFLRGTWKHFQGMTITTRTTYHNCSRIILTSLRASQTLG